MKSITIMVTDSKYNTYKRHSQSVDVEKLLEMEDIDFNTMVQDSKLAFDIDTLFDVDAALGMYLALSFGNSPVEWAWKTHRDVPDANYFKRLLNTRSCRNPITQYAPELSIKDVDELYASILGDKSNSGNIDAVKSIYTLAMGIKTPLFKFIEKIITDTKRRISILGLDYRDSGISLEKCKIVEKELIKVFGDEIVSKRFKFEAYDATSEYTISSFDEVYFNDIEFVKTIVSKNSDVIDKMMENKSILVPNWDYNLSLSDKNYVNIDENLLYAMLSRCCSVGTFTSR